MKRAMITCVVTFGMMLLLTACGENTSVSETEIIPIQGTESESESEFESDFEVSETTETVGADGIDIDLTVLSSTFVYSEVYNMMVAPENYIGKKVKMTGEFSVYEEPETGQMYYACVISDATACCAQGIEFVLDKAYVYPDDYPDVGSNITVTGIFETYEENGNRYCQLVDAEMDNCFAY